MAYVSPPGETTTHELKPDTPASIGGNRMKTFCRIILSFLVVAAVAFTDSHIGPTSVMAASPSSAQAPGHYGIDVQVSQAAEGTAWRYTITKLTSDTKDLGHFIINFGNCGDRSPTIAN